MSSLTFCNFSQNPKILLVQVLFDLELRGPELYVSQAFNIEDKIKTVHLFWMKNGCQSTYHLPI